MKTVSIESITNNMVGEQSPTMLPQLKQKNVKTDT